MVPGAGRATLKCRDRHDAGDWNAALAYAGDSLNSGAESVRALALKSRCCVMRDARRSRWQYGSDPQIDPLDVHGIAERWLASPTSKNRAPWWRS